MEYLNLKITLPIPQEFSLPKPMMKYINENPQKPIAYYKLAKSCKYFYYKNHVIVSHFAKTHDYIWEVLAFDADWTGFDAPSVDLENFPCKIWILNFLTCYEEVDIKELIPKVYRCDVNSLHLEEQKISFKDFLFLSGSVNDIEFKRVQISYDDGSMVLLETILNSLKNIISFD
uniref:Uncharacterized protein n=1 Tax=Panagrolaimus davidi TaxID=227884 RepID=A0A914QCE2_9BILA